MSYCLMCNSDFKAKLNYANLFSSKSNSKFVLCSSCRRRFEKLPASCCQWCNQPLPKNSAKFCRGCQYWQSIYPNQLLKNYALYRYNDAFHDLMVQYKRYGDYILCEVLDSLITKLPEADFYVPLPTSPSHYQKRKFDTIQAIFAQKKTLTQVLEKNDSESAQGEKNRQERLATKQTFSVKTGTKLEGRVLLLDDIYTTGRTLYHARDALQQAFPAITIKSFTIAR